MPIDLTGKKFGRLLVISEAARRKRPNGARPRYWSCACECGNRVEVAQNALTPITVTKSCGCFQRENRRNLAESNTKHGMHSSREYSSWASMLQRCNNPKTAEYRHYGGRGISVCPEWSDFQRFYEDMGPRPSRTSLDRIDNSLGYFPGNCRWATNRQQNNNTRKSRKITYNGKTRTLAEWARHLDMHPLTLWNRLDRGWTLERAMTQPVQKKNGAAYERARRAVA